MENPAAPAPHPKIAEALAFLQAAEQSAATGDPARVAWTVQQFDEGLSRLQPFLKDGGDPLRWFSLGLLGRANVLRSRGAAGLADALKSYDDAAKVLMAASATGPSEEFRRDDLGNVWINRGLALLAAGTPEQLAEAVKNFDACIELRTGLSEGPNPLPGPRPMTARPRRVGPSRPHKQPSVRLASDGPGRAAGSARARRRGRPAGRGSRGRGPCGRRPGPDRRPAARAGQAGCRARDTDTCPDRPGIRRGS